MFNRGRSKLHCGLHILDTHAQLIELDGRGRMLKPGRKETIQLEPGSIVNGKIIDEASVVERIRSMVESLELQGSFVNLTVPTSNVILRRSVFASLRDKELRNLIDVELHSGGSKIPFKNPVFDFIRLGPPRREESKPKSKQQEDVLVIASPLEVVEAYTQIAKLAGLEPVFVEPSLLSLYRVLVRQWKYAGEPMPERFVLLQTDRLHTELSIFVEGIPVFMLVLNALNGLSVNSAEAYARNLQTELSRVLNYYKYSVSLDQKDVQAMYLVGDSEWTSSLVEVFGTLFEDGIKLLTLGDLLNVNETDYDPYAVSLGLAMKGA